MILEQQFQYELSHAEVQHAHQSVYLLRAIVVTGDRLHALVDAEHEHDEHSVFVRVYIKWAKKVV